MHPAEMLWGEHEPKEGYPKRVTRIPEPIRGTAFFPGGFGLWNPDRAEKLPEFPVGGVMVLGQDFHSETGYAGSLKAGEESPKQPTWRNLVSLLRSAGIPLEQCFFTNAYVGLRTGARATGTFPGADDPVFVAHCENFLIRQLQVQRPRLILTLGIQASYFLGCISPDLKLWSYERGLKRLDANGPVQTAVKFPELPGFRTTAVALMHPSLRFAGVRHRSYKGLAGAAAEALMLRDGLASAFAAAR